MRKWDVENTHVALVITGIILIILAVGVATAINHRTSVPVMLKDGECNKVTLHSSDSGDIDELVCRQNNKLFVVAKASGH